MNFSQLHLRLQWVTPGGKIRLTGHGIAYKLHGTQMCVCEENHWMRESSVVDVSEPEVNWYNSVCPECRGGLAATTIEVFRHSKRRKITLLTLLRTAQIKRRGVWTAMVM